MCTSNVIDKGFDFVGGLPGVKEIFPNPKSPGVARSDPQKDQARIEAEAAQKAVQERTARRRRMRSSSLLGGAGLGGDEDPTTYQPIAVAGSKTLG